MVSINYSSREVCCKIVYYGPGLSGKTTNLLYIHSKVPGDTRGKMISLATEADRTLYFDFLPINIGTINGFAAKFQLYTVPGQVYYNATRKLVLRGVDGVVFVADSQPDKMDENIESLLNLEDNLKEYGYDINELPMVIQYNKCDLPGVLNAEQMDAKLNRRNLPSFVASATVGNGVFDTLKMIIKLVLDKAKNTASSNAPKKTMITENPAQKETPEFQPTSEQVSNPHVSEPQNQAEPNPPMESKPAPAPNTETQAAEESNVAVATTQEATKQEAAEDPYRPYPGSKTGKVSIVNNNQAEAVSSQANQPQQVNNSSNEDASSSQAPQMAPSVKKRKEKKRGFFKRLFGIK